MTSPSSGVGPVLIANEIGHAVARAVQAANRDVVLLDRGAYLRLLAPSPCRVGRADVERVLGKPFLIPQDLEAVMPSFAGVIRLERDSVEWK
jgi:hypothetical protein